MCSFLLLFLVLIVTFSHLQDFAQAQVRYPEAQGQAQTGSGSQAVVPAQNWKGCLVSFISDSCQEHIFQAPFEGSSLFEQNIIGNLQYNGCRRSLSMGLPVWAAQQKISKPMCHLLVSLDKRQKTRCYSEATDLWECRQVGKCLESVGAWMGRLESGMGRCRKCWSSILSFAKGTCDSSRGLLTKRENIQRKRKNQEQEQEQGQKREQYKPVWPWKHKFCTVALMAIMESSGTQFVTISIDSVQQKQHYAGNGCSFASSIQGEGSPSGCASILGQSREGVQSQQHQVLAGCYQKFGSCSEGTERCSPSQKGASPTMDKTRRRRSQNLGNPTGKFQGSSGCPIRTGQQSKGRNRVVQEDIEGGERKFCERGQPIYPSANSRGDGGRQHRQCSGSRRAKAERSVARRVECLCWFSRPAGYRGPDTGGIRRRSAPHNKRQRSVEPAKTGQGQAKQ